MTGYGVQVLGWYDGDDVDCAGTTHDLRVTGSVDFPNKVRFVSCHFPYMTIPRLLCWLVYTGVGFDMMTLSSLSGGPTSHSGRH